MSENLIEFSMNFFKIVDRISATKHHISETTGIKFDAPDARLLGLDSLQQSLVACGTFMCGMQSLKLIAAQSYGPDWEKTYARMINAADSIERSENTSLEYLKRTIVTEVCFTIENLFSNLMRFIEKDYDKDRFVQIRNDIFRASKISDPEQKKTELQCLVSIRNSAHANGIHSHRDFEIYIDELKFTFEESKPITCFSWDHLLAALNRSIDISTSVILSETFISFKEEIPDRALVLLDSTE